MPLQTTVIGAYPKPSYLKIPDWFRLMYVEGTTGKTEGYNTTVFEKYRESTESKDEEKVVDRAIREVIQKQVNIGIDVVTDGEMRRDNYYLHFLRRLAGVDFNNLVDVSIRDSSYTCRSPTVMSEVKPSDDEPWCWLEWKQAQDVSSKPVKYTIPGPMTIMDGTFNKYYPDRRTWSEDLVKCINREVRSLATHGCRYIQIDEPVMMRYPEPAIEFGIDHLAQCFEGLGTEVQKIVHFCRGYPDKLDTDDYPKAPKEHYLHLSEKVDNAGFDVVAIEDAEAQNDLQLLKNFKKTSVILGAVRIARSNIETVDEIKSRIQDALKYISRHRLILAPDCGLGLLPEEIAEAKLTNMVAAAKAF